MRSLEMIFGNRSVVVLIQAVNQVQKETITGD